MKLKHIFLKLFKKQVFFAQSDLIVSAMQEFNTNYNKINDFSDNLITDTLKHYYSKNIFPNINSNFKNINRENLIPKNKTTILLQEYFLQGINNKISTSDYNKTHSKYHHKIASFINNYNVYDIFLIDNETGNVVYNVTKEIDFATSLLSGTYSKNNLAKLFHKMRFCKKQFHTEMSDFDIYLPSHGVPAAFIAAPIFKNNKNIGTLVMQISIDKINNITTANKSWDELGLGRTGETYIVGSDYKMRSDSRFIIENPNLFFNELKSNTKVSSKEFNQINLFKTTILYLTVKTKAIQSALAGISGTKMIKDYRNVDVFSSFTKLSIKDVNWVLLVEIDSKEILESIYLDAFKSIFFILLITIGVGVISVYFARSIYIPIKKLSDANRELELGNMQVHVPVISKDELGQLSEAFNKAVTAIQQQKETIVHKNRMLIEQRDELMTQSNNLAQLNERIINLNMQLEIKIKERTIKLKDQNDKLIQYAYYNAHKLRGPITTILGLLNLIKIDPSNTDKILYFLEKTIHNLDAVVHEIQDILQSPDFDQYRDNLILNP